MFYCRLSVLVLLLLGSCDGNSTATTNSLVNVTMAPTLTAKSVDIISSTYTPNTKLDNQTDMVSSQAETTPENFISLSTNSLPSSHTHQSSNSPGAISAAAAVEAAQTDSSTAAVATAGDVTSDTTPSLGTAAPQISSTVLTKIVASTTLTIKPSTTVIKKETAVTTPSSTMNTTITDSPSKSNIDTRDTTTPVLKLTSIANSVIHTSESIINVSTDSPMLAVKTNDSSTPLNHNATSQPGLPTASTTGKHYFGFPNIISSTT